MSISGVTRISIFMSHRFCFKPQIPDFRHRCAQKDDFHVTPVFDRPRSCKPTGLSPINRKRFHLIYINWCSLVSCKGSTNQFCQLYPVLSIISLSVEPQISSSHRYGIKQKKRRIFRFSSSEMECGGRDSNSHRIAPTTPSK